MEIKKIMVLGAGQMGGGIAQVCAQAGYQVIMRDVNEEFLSRGLKIIENNLDRSLKNGRISAEEKNAALARIATTLSLEDAQGVDVVIEAIVEDAQIKHHTFAELDRICSPQTILASNTSSLPITQIAAATKRPAKVIGMHFMNPVPVMKLVEVICGLATSAETNRLIVDLAKTLGKVPVEVSDYPGFVANRILLPMINEAVYCVMEGVGTVEGVDNVMKLGMNHPMGPLALADLIGLDTCLAILEVLYDGFKDSKYRPCPLLRKYVSAGWYGRKSGRGFYSYE